MQCGQTLDGAVQGQRLRYGILGLSVTLILAVVLIKGEYNFWARGLVIIPAYLGSMGAYSGLFKT